MVIKRKSSRVYKGSRKYMRKPKVSKNLTRAIKQVVKKSVETKIINVPDSASLGLTNTKNRVYGALSGLQYLAFDIFKVNQGVNDATTLGSGNRIGDKIRPMYLQFKGQMYGGNSHVLRVIVFRWHPTTTPTGAQILDNTYVSTFRAPFAPYEESSKDMYTILKDKYFTLSAAGDQNKIIKFTISRKKMAIMNFTSGSSSVGSNLIYVLMCQDGVVTLNTIDMVARLVYQDS